MKLIPEKTDLNEYLQCSKIIDCENEIIQKKATQLTEDLSDEIEKAKVIYEFVRDEIAHSSDINSNKVTYIASDVLIKGHGLCFAKSHLLAALLRCEGIPAGFCYQKLSIESDNESDVDKSGNGSKREHSINSYDKILHGLNGVYINNKWIRLDARGNKNGVNAHFSLDSEKLAYIPQIELGDVDYPSIYSEPHPEIIKILSSYSALDEVIEHIIGSLRDEIEI